MPEIRPVLNKINAFNAELGTTISFSWIGAQSHANRVVIREYDSPHTTVYDYKQKTMALKHTLRLEGNEEGELTQNIAYNLKNGHRYIAIVYTYDVNGNESLPSKEITFYCFHTPTFKFINFTNIDANGIAKITVNSIYLNVKYQQTDNESINEYQFILYDYQGNILTRSPMKYNSTADDILSWTLGGVTETETKENGELNYGRAYKIVCQATTVHGMILSTEQEFVVMQDTNGVGALITLKNLPDHTISISSHYKIINAEIDGEETYLYDTENNPYAIVLNNGSKVSFFEGFNMQSPWSITGIVKDCIPNSTVLFMKNNSNEYFEITYHEKNYSLSKKSYFLFKCVRKTTNYILRSEYLPISDDWYVINFKHENGYFALDAKKATDIGYELPS